MPRATHAPDKTRERPARFDPDAAERAKEPGRRRRARLAQYAPPDAPTLPTRRNAR